MRMRKKKHGAERMLACAEYIINGKEDISETPVVLEIGCGKGKFITEFAMHEPDTTFVAMEKISDVMLLAVEKAKGLGLNNLKFISGDAKNLEKYFSEGQVKRIYLNFSDPWPKAGHYKRRLTYREFIKIYKKILTKDGAIFLKTDNTVLFDFSIEELEAEGFTVKNITRDLHSSEFQNGNIMTEYEGLFSGRGMKICRLEAYLNADAIC